MERENAFLLSVVIPTRNREQHLRECLAALAESTMADRIEVLVMDQSDADGSMRASEEASNDITVRYYKMLRLGACPARNLGAAVSAAPLVAFLDDDCCPPADWAAKITTTFQDDPALQFVFGQLRAPDGQPPSDGYYPEYLPTPEWQAQRSPREIAMVSAGANMIGRRDFLFAIGGFDELLGPDKPTVKSNDSSIAYKVLVSGRKWIASSDIEVIHKNGFRPAGELARLFQDYDHGLGVNWARFTRRGDLRAAWFWTLEQSSMTFEALRQIARLKRPRNVRSWAGHIKGFWDGFKLPGKYGYVDGAELRRLRSEPDGVARKRDLYPEAVASR